MEIPNEKNIQKNTIHKIHHFDNDGILSRRKQSNDLAYSASKNPFLNIIS